MGRKRASGGFDIPGWVLLVPCLVAPVVLLNVLVSWLGDTQVPALSFDFLETKARALGAYVAHRPECVLEEHPPLEPLIESAERRHGLPPGLLKALIQVESETHVHRISAAGAMGPGQLMPDTAAQMRVEDPFDPKPAIDASARYLAEQLRRFDDVRLAVAAYNAGPGAVRGHVPHNGETEFYVAKVLSAYARTRPPARVAVAAAPVPKAPAKPAAHAKPTVAARAAPATKSAPPKPGAGPKPGAPTRPAVTMKAAVTPGKAAPAKPSAPAARPSNAAMHGSPRGASVNRPTSAG